MGLASRKLGTLLKQIPDLSAKSLWLLELGLWERGLSFVADDSISPLECGYGTVSRLWRSGTFTYTQLSLFTFQELLLKCQGSSKGAFRLDDVLIARRYPSLDRLYVLNCEGFSNRTARWLIGRKVYSLNDLRDRLVRDRSMNFLPSMHSRGKGGRNRRDIRRELLYILRKHNIEFPGSKMAR